MASCNKIKGEIIYTAGQTLLLYKTLKEENKKPYNLSHVTDVYIDNFMKSLYKIGNDFKRLSEVYLVFLIKKNRLDSYYSKPNLFEDDKEHIHHKLIQHIFYSPIEEMPLLITQPILKSIAKWRIGLGI